MIFKLKTNAVYLTITFTVTKLFSQNYFYFFFFRFVHTFIIVFNGESPRMTLSLKSMIRLFEKMFGNQFWKNVIIGVTRLENYGHKNIN